MADDRHYVGGDNYILDDISGFKIRRSRAKQIPGGQTGGLYVDPRRWEPQQPQDFVTGVRDDQTVDVSRPRQRDQFVITGTSVVSFTAAGESFIIVDDIAGFEFGQTIQIMLDNGEPFQTTVLSVGPSGFGSGFGIMAFGTATFGGAGSGNVIQITGILPSSVGGPIGDPIENAVIVLPFASEGGPFILDESGSDILDFNVIQ